MLERTPLRRESAEVLISNQDFLTLQKADISDLKAAAQSSPRGRARICVHQSPAETVHEMTIAFHRSSYVRPHKHVNKPESMLILEGQGCYVRFDDDGTIAEAIDLGSYDSGRCFYLSTRLDQFHSVFATSDLLVILEVTRGPFTRGDTIFAPWGPEDSEQAAAQQYMTDLRQSIALR